MLDIPVSETKGNYDIGSVVVDIYIKWDTVIKGSHPISIISTQV